MDFVASAFDRLPFPDRSFDLVWCAQSLFSLPDPVVAIGHMSRMLRPGGLVAVLENDTLHQVLLPWPVALELPLRAAELRSFQEESRTSSRYYVGRRLPAALAAAGLDPEQTTTLAFDRQAPWARPSGSSCSATSSRSWTASRPTSSPSCSTSSVSSSTRTRRNACSSAPTSP
jgi:SAM-dependent methyltransferase